MGRAPWCVQCGSTVDLEMHHKNGDPTDNRPENTEMRCETCHHAVHDG